MERENRLDSEDFEVVPGTSKQSQNIQDFQSETSNTSEDNQSVSSDELDKNNDFSEAGLNYEDAVNYVSVKRF